MRGLWTILLLLGFVPSASPGQPVAETFTYQGLLLDEFGLPYNGDCELEFRLFESQTGDDPIGSPVVVCFDGLEGNPAPLQNGLVGIELDFGPGLFNGPVRWLQVAVACPCGTNPDDLITLTPRQKITPAPYSIRALRLDGLTAEQFLRADLPGAIGQFHIGTNAVHSRQIAAGAVGAEEIASNAVDGDAIARNAVGQEEIAMAAVGDQELALDAQSLAKVSGGLMHSVDGKIGINTNAPEEMLDVSGRIFASGDIISGDDVIAMGQLEANGLLRVDDKAVIGPGTPDGQLAIWGKGDGRVLSVRNSSGALIFEVDDDGDVVAQGTVSIGTLFAEAPLHVKVEGHDPFEGTDHVAIFENIGGASPDGIAIKLNTAAPNSSNNFVTFYDASGGVRGRIEGVDAGDATEALNELSFTVLFGLGQGVVGCLCDLFPFPSCDVPTTLEEFNEFVNCVQSEFGQDLACDIAEYGTGLIAAPSVGDVLNVSAQVLCKLDGVTYGSHGADYAEWLPKDDPAEVFGLGQIVGIDDGKATKVTQNAQQVMVVSIAPVVVGNMPPAEEEDDYVKVAFMGQVPVWVRGKVEVGDFIVPSGYEDGTGVAISSEDLQAEHLDRIAGRAWSTSENAGLGLVNVLVGIKTNESAEIARRQASRISELEAQVSLLGAQVTRVDGLSRRLTALESRAASELPGRRALIASE